MLPGVPGAGEHNDILGGGGVDLERRMMTPKCKTWYGVKNIIRLLFVGCGGKAGATARNVKANPRTLQCKGDVGASALANCLASDWGLRGWDGGRGCTGFGNFT